MRGLEYPKNKHLYAGEILLYLGFWTFLFTTFTSKAQQVAVLPVQFTHFFNTYSLANPSSIGQNTRMEISCGNKSLLGAFSGVRSIYAFGHYKFTRDSSLGGHALGLTFINDKEGSYIHRNRASMQYAAHIPLSAHTVFGAGVAVGIINYSFEGTNISAGGSDLAPNADVGLWLHRTNFNAGISFNQLIPSRLTPIEETYLIGKYYVVTMDKTVDLHPDFSLMSALLFRYESAENYNADVALKALFYKNLIIAASYKFQRGAAISGGLDKINIGNCAFKLILSYYSPLGGNMYYNPQSYDLMLSFVLK